MNIIKQHLLLLGRQQSQVFYNFSGQCQSLGTRFAKAGACEEHCFPSSSFNFSVPPSLRPSILPSFLSFFPPFISSFSLYLMLRKAAVVRWKRRLKEIKGELQKKKSSTDISSEWLLCYKQKLNNNVLGIESRIKRLRKPLLSF